MKTITSSIVMLLSLLSFSNVTCASTQGSAFAVQNVSSLLQLHDGDEKMAIDEAIQLYLAKNPPEALSAFIYSSVEKAMPASISETNRNKALSHIKENVTPDILKRMISAGLRRNFTVEEIHVLAQYDESQLSDDLKKKSEYFRLEVSDEIGLLLAATSG